MGRDQDSRTVVKFLYSYGGKILPRRTDGKLRYVGGHTRVLAVDRSISYAELMVKFGELCGSSVTLRCQLPKEDLDVLVTVTSDEELANVIEEYDRDSSSCSKIKAVLSPPKSVKTVSPVSSPANSARTTSPVSSTASSVDSPNLRWINTGRGAYRPDSPPELAYRCPGHRPAHKCPSIQTSRPIEFPHCIYRDMPKPYCNSFYRPCHVGGYHR